MAFRGGRGRGRGGFGRGSSFASTPQPFKLFPEDVALPDRKGVPLDADFFMWNHKLQQFFENSAYFVEESASKDCQSHDIERYSDSLKPRNKMKREALSDFMKLKPGYFPLELVKGVKVVNSQKKVKWSATLDTKRLDFFEKLEKNAKENGEKENNSDDEDEENDGEEDDGEYSTDGDYEQNKDFDDDEDDYNDKDDGDDEPFY